MKASKKTQARLDARVWAYQRHHIDGVDLGINNRKPNPMAFTRPGSRKKVC